MRYQSVFSLAKGLWKGQQDKTTPTTLIIPTPAKYHIKNCDPVLSHASKGPEGGLDLCSSTRLWWSLPSLPALWCQRLGESQDIHPNLAILRPPPLLCQWRVLGAWTFIPPGNRDTFSQLPFSTRVVSKEACGESGLAVPCKGEPLSLMYGVTGCHVGNSNKALYCTQPESRLSGGVRGATGLSGPAKA